MSGNSSTAITIQPGQNQLTWGGNTYQVNANNPVSTVNIYTIGGIIPTAVDSNSCVCNANWASGTTGTTYLAMGPINNGTYCIITGSSGSGGTYLSGFLTLQGYQGGATGNQMSLVAQTNKISTLLTYYSAGTTPFIGGVVIPTNGWYFYVNAAPGYQFNTFKVSQIC